MMQKHQSVVLAGLLAMALGLAVCAGLRGGGRTGQGAQIGRACCRENV